MGIKRAVQEEAPSGGGVVITEGIKERALVLMTTTGPQGTGVSMCLSPTAARDVAEALRAAAQDAEG